MPLIRVAAVLITDVEGHILTVRKRDTERFMLPGGKPEPGETFLQTAVREVEEELGLRLRPSELNPLGEFHSDAANEPGHDLESHVFTYARHLDQMPQVAAEIEELRWFSESELRCPAPGTLLAPMLQFDAVSAFFGESLPAAYAEMHRRVVGSRPQPGDRALSVVQYDAARRDHLQNRGVTSRVGVAQWPPTSQTLMKQLGDGSWALAMQHLGYETASGRARGAATFGEETYRETVQAFLDAVANQHRPDVGSESFAQFTAWIAVEKTADVKRPSAAAVRRHYGSWDAAKRAACTPRGR